ncbi:MAG TPA: TetR/AcrR family transcriptional regulator [Steroidobacteraceae bacterium]|nr:TetR/AcrR family transcriptional regulator [Steroidobacteraceae bacterium]
MQSRSKPITSLADRKKLMVRETILDAAERFLRSEVAGDLTMRGLAEEAGVSLGTLFNHFGSKGGILAGLSDRMLETIAGVYRDALTNEDPMGRVFAIGRAGAHVLLSDTKYYRYICRSIAIEGDLNAVGSERQSAEKLWCLALASDPFLRADVSGLHDTYVPQQLGVVFRGVLVMWVTGMISDANFARAIETSLAGVMLGLVEEKQRPALILRMVRF